MSSLFFSFSSLFLYHFILFLFRERANMCTVPSDNICSDIFCLDECLNDVHHADWRNFCRAVLYAMLSLPCWGNSKNICFVCGYEKSLSFWVTILASVLLWGTPLRELLKDWRSSWLNRNNHEEWRSLMRNSIKRTPKGLKKQWIE